MEYKEYTYYIEIEEKNRKPKVTKSAFNSKLLLLALLPFCPLLLFMLAASEKIPSMKYFD